MTKAAENGHKVAMFDLARIFKKMGNDEKYLEWMTKAADLDLIPAQLTLSEIYAQGKNVPKNIEKAKEYLQKAAKRGSIRAKKLLKNYK